MVEVVVLSRSLVPDGVWLLVELWPLMVVVVVPARSLLPGSAWLMVELAVPSRFSVLSLVPGAGIE